MTELGALGTEGRADALADLDQRSAAEIVGAVVGGHAAVLDAVTAAEPAIAALVAAAGQRLKPGGRPINARACKAASE